MDLDDHQTSRARGRERYPDEELSDREFQVLCLLGSGMKVKQIADELCLSYRTVSTYRSRIMIKLGLDTDAQLVRYAVEQVSIRD